MRGQNMAKIHILGGAGSGKSTLARRLATKLQVPHYDLDVLGRKNGTDAAAHIADQMRIAYEPGWVVEGIYVVLIDPLLDAANTIVLLDVAWPVAAWRIIKRHISTTLRGTNEYPDLHLLLGYSPMQMATTVTGATNCPTLWSRASQRSAMALPPTTEAMVQHLKAYHPVSIPPTVAYVRSYVEKYQDKVVVVKTKADYAQLLACLTHTSA